jgi:pimeloyl-ACP methyl ester carboxylesterase
VKPGWSRLPALALSIAAMALTATCRRSRHEAAPYDWRAERRAPDYDRTPVLLVHGYGGSPAVWAGMIEGLSALGYPPEYLSAVDIGFSARGNADAARSALVPAGAALLRRAERVAGQAGRARRFARHDLVAHSMGAVSSRLYAKWHPERVRVLVSLAGANHGTNRLCTFEDGAAREMCPAYSLDGGVQAELNGTAQVPGDETPFGIGEDGPARPHVPADASRRILYFAVSVEADKWILPAQSAELDGAGGVPLSPPALLRERLPGNFSLPEVEADHDSLLGHPDVIRLVARMLASYREDDTPSARPTPGPRAGLSGAAPAETP